MEERRKKERKGLENRCPQAIQVPVLVGYFYRHKIVGNIWDWDKTAVIDLFQKKKTGELFPIL